MTASDDPQGTTAWRFQGFVEPVDHYTKMPHTFIDLLPHIDTKAELALLVYILRHTWGFGEFDQPKKITPDEFVHGRRRKDRSRMDGGVGMSKNAVMDGLNLAIEHGFIEVERDNHDAARKRKSYRLVMVEPVRQGRKDCTPEVQKLHIVQRKKLLKEKGERTTQAGTRLKARPFLKNLKRSCTPCPMAAN